MRKEWSAYLKDRQPKTLIVWGRNDPLILPAAAEFVKQVLPTAELRYFDGGHFVLAEYADDRRGNHRDVHPIGVTTR